MAELAELLQHKSPIFFPPKNYLFWGNRQLSRSLHKDGPLHDGAPDVGSHTIRQSRQCWEILHIKWNLVRYQSRLQKKKKKISPSSNQPKKKRQAWGQHLKARAWLRLQTWSNVTADLKQNHSTPYIRCTPDGSQSGTQEALQRGRLNFMNSTVNIFNFSSQLACKVYVSAADCFRSWHDGLFVWVE